MFTIPATGRRPITFAAENLPEGLQLDSKTGRITGSIQKRGEYIVILSAKNDLGQDQRELENRLRRHDRPYAAHGLEQLELLRRARSMTPKSARPPMPWSKAD